VAVALTLAGLELAAVVCSKIEGEMSDEGPKTDGEPIDVRPIASAEPIDERPQGEETFGLFLSPSDQGGGGFYVPMRPLNVGPGEPGPGDEWHVPTEPVQPEDDVTLERVRPEGVELLPPAHPDRVSRP
jgi:hypothetical protein